VSRTSSATTRSLRLVAPPARRRIVNAWSSVTLREAITMPTAAPIRRARHQRGLKIGDCCSAQGVRLSPHARSLRGRRRRQPAAPRSCPDRRCGCFTLNELRGDLRGGWLPPAHSARYRPGEPGARPRGCGVIRPCSYPNPRPHPAWRRHPPINHVADAGPAPDKIGETQARPITTYLFVQLPDGVWPISVQEPPGTDRFGRR
jgi:hypothetical protein